MDYAAWVRQFQEGFTRAVSETLEGALEAIPAEEFGKLAAQRLNQIYAVPDDRMDS